MANDFTTEQVLDRLRILLGKLVADGAYVSANTVGLAIDEIEAKMPQSVEHDDGQPDEQQEWLDYDKDC